MYAKEELGYGEMAPGRDFETQAVGFVEDRLTTGRRRAFSDREWRWRGEADMRNMIKAGKIGKDRENV